MNNKVILTETKNSGLGWSSVIRPGRAVKVLTALRNGEITGKICKGYGQGPLFKVKIDEPWDALFKFKNLSFDKIDLVFVEDVFLSDDDIAI